ELHHAGIGEHQGRIVDRHERRGRHDLVAVAGKVVEEARPDLVDAAHSRMTSTAPQPARAMIGEPPGHPLAPWHPTGPGLRCFYRRPRALSRKRPPEVPVHLPMER